MALKTERGGRYLEICVITGYVKDYPHAWQRNTKSVIRIQIGKGQWEQRNNQMMIQS